jgi:hypothetical protein
MRNLLRGIGWVFGLAFWSAQATAAAMTPDPTGMWYEPEQPGWGMSVTQQGDTVFAVLFVYDNNGLPRWFVASNIVDTGASPNFLVSEVHSGTLYQTTGPALLVPSDPAAFKVTAVGTIQLAYVQPTNNLSVTYTINGTTVSKVVAPQTWGSNAPTLIGKYGAAITGGIFIDSTPSCRPSTLLEDISDFNIDPTVDPDTFRMFWTRADNTECWVSGTYAQRGQFGSFAGPVMCAPMIVNAVSVGMGSLSVTQMTIGPGGFSGSLDYKLPDVSGNGCAVAGSIGGAQRGQPGGNPAAISPDPTGMWYDPAHLGWGMNLTQQGATNFAVIYVYDNANAPRWYVASNVVDSGRAWSASDGFSGNPGELYSGTLYETRGTYFGSTSPMQVTTSPVGTFSMAYTGDKPRALSVRYDVLGSAVVKTVQPQTFLSNIAQLSGTYAGAVVIHPCACFPELCDSPISSSAAMQITATPGPSPSALQLVWNLGSPIGACKYSATYAQDGQLGSLQGSVACDGNPSSLPFTVTNLTIGANGFSGVADLPGFCPGAIGGVKVQ